MPISKAARHDLYNGLTELLGLDRADTLMAYLPEFDPSQVATKSDITELRAATKSDILELRAATKAEFLELRAATKSDITELRTATKADFLELRSATKSDITELRAATKTDMARIEGNLGDLKGGQAVLHSRIDRLFVTLVAGLFVIVAAMAGFVFTAL